MKAVAVRDLDLSYGKVQVLKKVAFEVSGGEFVVIIGPNGTGKTSLLKALVGLVKTSGSIEILGRNLAEYSRKELAVSVAVVPQQVALDFPFTVAETVLMGRSPHLGLLESEGDHDRRIAREAMEFTDIATLADRRLDELSGGERQRVIIARAICQEPRLIMLDEPTASLDPAHQVRIMDLMERLRRERGTTVIMVSHDLNLAAMYGERLILLKDGRVSASGTLDEVLVAGLLEENYGCRMVVERGSKGGVLRVFPVPDKFC
ncbi:MAG: ABC transporter ATP-binding protein [Proteobacteria bacterium]|nr:ABC transporter ATP-binding protein [Pseudomonadota bacterium]MBU1738582.1 ABC transporter ATP-binding protein [Pseudomonadota bacterium]